jgi:tetratricopeptide (TPR) repeat protein
MMSVDDDAGAPAAMPETAEQPSNPGAAAPAPGPSPMPAPQRMVPVGPAARRPLRPVQGGLGGRRPMPAQPNPQIADPVIAEGNAALQRGDLTLAELRAMQALQQVPDHLEALILLYQCRKRTGQGGPKLENVLRAIVRKSPNLFWATNELAFMLFGRGERVECEIHARNAIRLAPRDPAAHGIMGLMLTETNRALAGEHHFRKAIELAGENSRVDTNLANCLKAQGKVEESEEWFSKAVALGPRNVGALLGWARLEEARRSFPKAWELLQKVEEIAPDAPDLSLTRAVLYGREKKNEKAVAELSKSKSEGQKQQMTAVALFERGRLYDKMDRFDEAWADFTEANRLCREVQGRVYGEAMASNLAERLKSFFVRSRMSLLPRGGQDEHRPQPIFIVGYPRSGTTMVEQTLTALPGVSAGDELVFINDLTRVGPRFLGSPLPYPESLADLWMGDNLLVLDQYRDYYLDRAGQLGIWEKGAKFFTDKMPLNETHLGLIHLIFPKAPIVHVRRHPLDILVSNYSNFLTHGYNQAFDVTTIAKHYALVDGLVSHYREQLDLNYLEVRYEDLVSDQETNVRSLLQFCGLDFDKKVLSFHENQRYARTASYAQVTEKLYDSSVFRYRHYRKNLDAAVEILKPVIERLGYTVD